MKAQIELPDAFYNLTQITQLLKEILNEIQTLKYSNYNEWLNATDFCKKYGISRPTLYKRAKQGVIEVCNFGGDVNRYRMKINNEE